MFIVRNWYILLAEFLAQLGTASHVSLCDVPNNTKYERRSRAMKSLSSEMSVVLFAAMCTVMIARPVLASQVANEMGLLDPLSFTDLTVQGMGMFDPESRLEVGPLVARRKAFTAEGMSLEILNASYDNLTDGSWITVRVRNVEGFNASHHDLTREWIGVFQSGIPANSTVPVKYTLLTADPSYVETGEATFSFRLINMRVPFDIVFFDSCKVPGLKDDDRSLSGCEATLRAGPITFARPGQPLRPATLITGDSHSINIVWTSTSTTNNPFLEYRKLDERPTPPFERPAPANAAYVRVAVQSAAPYSRSTLCGTPANAYGYFDPGVRHSAVVEGLATSSWYAYRFGDDDHGASNEFAFWQPPGPNPDANITLITFGDLGRGDRDGTVTWTKAGVPPLNTSRRMAAYIESTTVDGIFHIGDLSYASGYLNIWDTYAEMMTSTLSHTPYAVLVGNHETDVPVSQTPPDRLVTLFNGTDSGGECSVPTGGWYPMPWKSLDAPWYSYDVGPMHIVGISTEHNFFIGSPQYQWIEQDLASVNKSVTPWILFGGHRPMYIDSTEDDGWGSDVVTMGMMIENLEPLLLRYKVDVAVWGHNHVVQRFCMLNNRNCVQFGSKPGNTYTKDNGGVMHLVIGAAGATFSINVHNPWLPMTENAFYEYGYSRMRVQGGESLVWEWLDNEMDPSAVRDSITIVRQPAAGASSPSDTGLSHGAIAGIAVGAAVAGVIVIVLIVKLASRRKSYRPHELIAEDDQQMKNYYSTPKSSTLGSHYL
jgi:hypothetical protein